MQKVSFKRLLFTVCYFGLSIAATALNIQDLDQASLKYNGDKVKLKSPIIKEDNLIYIPLRDLTGPYNNTLKYNQKKQEYHFTLASNDLVTFAMYWPKFTHKGQYYFWSGLPIRYRNRIYVPLDDAQNWFDGKLSASLGKTEEKQPKQSEKPFKQNQVWKLSAKAIPTELLPLPKPALSKPLSIVVQNNTLKLSNNHRYVDGELWLNFQSIFRHLGYKIQNKPQGYIASNKTHRFEFKLKTSPLPLKKIDNQWYSPLKNTALALGWVPYWKYNKVYFLNKIDHISLYKNKDKLSLKISSTFPLSHSEITPISDNKFYIDLRNSFFDAQTHQAYPENNIIEQIVLGNHPLFNRLVITSKQAKLAEIDRSTKHTVLTLPYKGTMKHLTTTPRRVAKKKLLNFFKKKTIAIDPGHGGIDPGAVLSGHEKQEKHYVWEISKHLKHHLERKGYRVVMLREWDKNPSLWQRVDKANKNKCDAIISVHLNSFTDHQINGTETYYYKAQDKGLAKYMHASILDTLKLKDNGLKKAKMYVLNHSKMPGVLIEPAYMTHKDNFEFIQSSHFKELLSNAIENGLKNYFESLP